MARSWTTTSARETRAVGRELGRQLAPDGVLLLYGELAAGKTVLAQGVAEALGIDPADVQSPSFTLIREHRGSAGRLIHVDLYRLQPGEVEELPLDEILETTAVKVVEWAERLPRAVPGARRVGLAVASDGRRQIRVIA